jgi:hypothetical protein
VAQSDSEASFPLAISAGTFLSVRQTTAPLGWATLTSKSIGRAPSEFRPSKYARAAPILEGLTILAGFGVVFPAGTYDASDPTQQALSIGNSTWDFAPTFGLTYTTPPILAEGTEISVRFFWNNYLENPTTHYSAGDLLDLEFALTERIGRFQVGAAGFYFWQPEDDELFGVVVPPAACQGSSTRSHRQLRHARIWLLRKAQGPIHAHRRKQRKVFRRGLWVDQEVLIALSDFLEVSSRDMSAVGH